jgi:chromosome segregation ATPase
MSRSEHALILCFALFLPLVGTGCRTTGAATAGDGGGDEAEERADELRDKRREVELKRLELKIAELDGENELENAREDLAEAARALDEAQQALALFREKERALELADAENDLSGARQRVVEERADLQQIELAYGAGDYADGVEEIVLARHKARLAIMERNLALGEEKLALLSAHELPLKERSLVDELRGAQRAHREAEHALAHQKLESKLSLMSLEHELDELREELAELEPEGAAAQSAVDDGDVGDPPLQPKEPPPPGTRTEGT